MIDKIADKIMARARLKMPEIDDERAELIRYGLELMIGEIPKFVLMLVISLLLGKIKYFLISIAIICPYRISSGGVHLKTHIGCFTMTNLVYLGNVYISEYVTFSDMHIKYAVSIFIYLFAIIMILLNAPADTENVPILRKKVRKSKKITSIILVSIYIIISVVYDKQIISNLFLFGVFIQTITITKVIYKIFRVKFGYFEYIKNEQ